MKKINFYCCILLSLLVFPGMAQHTLNGNISDAGTAVALPFVNIAIAGEARGTLSNEEGKFTLQVPSLPQRLLISHLGYEKQEITVNADNELLQIKLVPAETVLPEVTVMDNWAEQLVLKAFEKARESAEKRYEAKAFYRQKTKQNEVYTELQEVFLDTKVSGREIEGWNLEQARYARREADQHGYITFRNCLQFAGSLKKYEEGEKAKAFPVSKDAVLYFDFQLKELVHSQGKEIAVISFASADKTIQFPVHGELYIDVNSYHILKIIQAFPSPDDGSWGHKIKNTIGNYEIGYRVNEDSVSVVEYIKVETRLDHLKGNKINRKVLVTGTMFFYDYKPCTTEKTYLPVKTKLSDLELIKKSAYNKEFWQNNPVIQRTPVEEEVIRSFEAEGAFGNMIEQKK